MQFVVYSISNLYNNKLYVGSSVNFKYRKWCHINALKNNKHHSPILQNSWNKYGEYQFQFDIIEIVNNKNNLIEREQFWIDFLNPEFNCSPTAGSPLGVKHTIKARKNMSKAHKGKKLSPKSILKRSLKQSGKNHWNYGCNMSDETKRKISESLKLFNKNNNRKKYNHTEETKNKLSKKFMIPIYQYDLNYNFIKEWEGIKPAAKELKIRETSIIDCLKGRRTDYKNFIWRYKCEKKVM